MDGGMKNFTLGKTSVLVWSCEGLCPDNQFSFDHVKVSVLSSSLIISSYMTFYNRFQCSLPPDHQVSYDLVKVSMPSASLIISSHMALWTFLCPLHHWSSVLIWPCKRFCALYLLIIKSHMTLSSVPSVSLIIRSHMTLWKFLCPLLPWSSGLIWPCEHFHVLCITDHNFSYGLVKVSRMMWRFSCLTICLHMTLWRFHAVLYQDRLQLLKISGTKYIL